MGLVASQARLMLLTSRKSDIEFQVQNINNRRLRITYQTSKLATDYSDKLNNKILKFRNGDSSLADVSIDSTTGKINSNDYAFYTSNGTKVTSFKKDSSGAITPNGSNGTDVTGAELGLYLSQAVSGGVLHIGTSTNSTTTTCNNLSDTLYTDDDDSATATYEAALAPLQTQDKKLELDMKNLETQYKAVTAEIDGVSKVLTDNIQKTFKIFAGQ